MAAGDGNSIGRGSSGRQVSSPVSSSGGSDLDRLLTPEELRRLAVEIMAFAIMIGWLLAVLLKNFLGLPQGFFNHVIIASTLLGLLATRWLDILPWPWDEFREDWLFLMVWVLAAVLFPTLREGTVLPGWLLGRDAWFSTAAAMSLAFGLIYQVGRKVGRLRPIVRLALTDTLIR